MPFSAGPRNCLGEFLVVLKALVAILTWVPGQKFAMRNVKTLLASVLREYNIKCQQPLEDMKYTIEIVLRPVNGLHVAFERRRK